MTSPKHARGFSLMELMIVVVIMGILLAIAVPAYNEYVITSKLTEGTAQLSTMRTRMEQFYQDNRTYVGACDAGSRVVPPATNLFAFACANLTLTTYTIQANGRNSLNGFQFTINQAGTKTSTSTLSGWNNGASCWITKPGATC